LSGKASQKLPINGVDGKPLKSPEEEAKGWRGHFSEVLNCPELTMTYNFSNKLVITLDINKEEITMDEVRNTITK